MSSKRDFSLSPPCAIAFHRNVEKSSTRCLWVFQGVRRIRETETAGPWVTRQQIRGSSGDRCASVPAALDCPHRDPFIDSQDQDRRHAGARVGHAGTDERAARGRRRCRARQLLPRHRRGAGALDSRAAHGLRREGGSSRRRRPGRSSGPAHPGGCAPRAAAARHRHPGGVRARGRCRAGRNPDHIRGPGPGRRARVHHPPGRRPPQRRGRGCSRVRG